MSFILYQVTLPLSREYNELYDLGAWGQQHGTKQRIPLTHNPKPNKVLQRLIFFIELHNDHSARI
jgi:hypothetical protein